MIIFESQNEVEPHVIPSGDGREPPPFIRFIKRTTMNINTSALILENGMLLSSSRIFCKSSSITSSIGPYSDDSILSSRDPSLSSSLPCSSLRANFVNSDSFSFEFASSSLIKILSFLYIFFAFLSVLKPVKLRSSTRHMIRYFSGRSLLMKAPISAPDMVSGSITRIRSQSISGRSANGWRLFQFKIVFAIAPPKTVTLLKGMAYLVLNPSTRIYIGTSIPPPPIPPPAATIRPKVAKKNPYKSRVSIG
mmetsp:Transcript_5411/g.7302  ORF Transcript_5411/g.7302 Transcript_5411/m.7302 type:complete len:250 (+) Transcript_5411:576-1325(+)